MLKLVVLPAISLIVMVPLTMLVIGPTGVYAGEAIAFVVNWLIERSSVFAGVLVGGGWSVLVSMGIHWAVNPIMINNIAQNGFDYICPFTFACNFAVIGCAFGVFLKARDQKLKSFAMTGVVSIALSAIIEPTLFRYAREEQEGLACADHRRCRRRRVPRYHEGRHHCVHLRFRHYVPGFREFRPHELRLGYGRHAHFRRRGRCSCLRLHRQGRISSPKSPGCAASPRGRSLRLKSVALTRGVSTLVQIVNERVGQSIKRSSSQQVAAAILLVRYTFRKEMNEREAEWFGEVPNMIPYERRERIVECLQKSGLARISELQEELPGVSISTLRRDLKELEALGKVEHLSGGAVRLLSAVHEVRYLDAFGPTGVRRNRLPKSPCVLLRTGTRSTWTRVPPARRCCVCCSTAT